MLIPIGTDLPCKRQPTVTYVIIVVNLLIHAIQWAIKRSETTNEAMQDLAHFLSNCALSDISILHSYGSTLCTHLFLHYDWWHVAGNMIFLLPFGRVVENRIGHVYFAMLYLGCGALAGFTQLTSPNSIYFLGAIGASGSVAAITAAFVVLAPASRIKVLFIFFIISIFYIPSILFVGFYVLLNAFDQIGEMVKAELSNIGHLAHLTGYASGFMITCCLLATGLVKRSKNDLLYLMKQSYRRKSYRKIVSQVHDQNIDTSSKDNPLSMLAASISQAAATGNPLVAADQYLEALDNEPSLQLNQKTQLLIGSSLIKSGRVEDGVRVYEMYLKNHAKADDLGDVALLLIAKYTRDLNNEERAKELLHDYSSVFSESHQKLVTTLTQELEH